MKTRLFLLGIIGLIVCPLNLIGQTTRNKEQVIVNGGEKVYKQSLTTEEKKKPYAKYFYMPMAKPNQALVDSVNKGSINSASALDFDHLNDILKPGYLPSEIGYCILPDGTGYVSSIIKMPNVTPQMIDWWFTWHELESLRYKIWNHDVHYGISVSDADRKKLLDETIPLNERNWNVTHHVKEDIGLGMSEIKIHFVSPKEFGFDMNQFKEPNVSTAICAIGGSKMLHFLRKIDGGVELRTRFWFPAEAKVPIELLKGLNYHALEEYTNLAKILPSLYKEYGPKN
jgi:hypothetical protein